jgi:hypothetical protein
VKTAFEENSYQLIEVPHEPIADALGGVARLRVKRQPNQSRTLYVRAGRNSDGALCSGM